MTPAENACAGLRFRFLSSIHFRKRRLFTVGALALQKFTKPAVTGVPPAATEAVSVTSVPAETLLDDTLSVVVVGVVVADAAPTKMTNAIKMRCHVVIVDVRATE